MQMALDIELAAGWNLGQVAGEVVAAAGQVDVRALAAQSLPGLDRERVAIDRVFLVDRHGLLFEEIPIGIEQVIGICAVVCADHSQPPFAERGSSLLERSLGDRIETAEIIHPPSSTPVVQNA